MQRPHNAWLSCSIHQTKLNPQPLEPVLVVRYATDHEASFALVAMQPEVDTVPFLCQCSLPGVQHASLLCFFHDSGRGTQLTCGSAAYEGWEQMAAGCLSARRDTNAQACFQLAFCFLVHEQP